jgi:branched-subunit amino acid ABC-type transport system permease component
MELLILALLRAGNYVLIAVGFALVFGSLRILNLMHLSFVMLGGYGAYLEIRSRSHTGVKPGPRCVPCQHNTVAFLKGSDFYVPLGADLRQPIGV